MTVIDLLFLYVAFRVKHYLCDFPLQSTWMAIEKGNAGWAGYKPLFVHCGIHGAGAALIALAYAPALVWIGIVDFVIHLIIDRAKAVGARKHKWTVSDKAFWWSLGFDQELHNATNLLLIVIIFIGLGGIVIE